MRGRIAYLKDNKNKAFQSFPEQNEYKWKYIRDLKLSTKFFIKLSVVIES